jgi:ferric-dicitrate binding protein FerR (iron transport regulator)
LLEKYVSGQCTPEERTRVEAYLQRTEDSTPFDEVLWQQWTQESDQPAGDVDTAGSLRRFKQKRRVRPVTLVRIAAGLLLLMTALGAGWWSTRSNGPVQRWLAPAVVYKEFVNATGQQAHLTLGDGSQVWLNVDSRLKYPEKFTNNGRNVYLTGEALFEVTQDRRKPFRVHTQRLVTTVLGTSFQVRAYADDRLAQVTVSTGKVAVQPVDSLRPTGRPYLLHPQQRVVLDKESGRMHQDSTDLTELTALKSGDLYLRDMTFREIARRLERWYGVQITIGSDALKTCAFSATFKRLPLRDVLDRLQLTAGFQYRITGKRVRIEGGSCE